MRPQDRCEHPYHGPLIGGEELFQRIWRFAAIVEQITGKFSLSAAKIEIFTAAFD